MKKKPVRGRFRKLEPRRRTPVGASPGTLSADPTAPAPILELLAYGPEQLEERSFTSAEDLKPLLHRHPVTWIDVAGLGSASIVRDLAEIFRIHPLAQEDILNAHQRPKVEPYGEHLFLVLRTFGRGNKQKDVQRGERRDEREARSDGGEEVEPKGGPFGSEQLSIYAGPTFLLTFQETTGNCLDPVRARIRQGGGRLRLRGPEYLAYALIDAVIDSYFPVLEDCGERLESLEEEILNRPGGGSVRRIHEIRRELLLLRRAAWPLREAINGLLRDPLPLITEETRPYLRDCYDHTVQIIDLIETYRELGADLTDVYLSSLSQRTNEVMRLLTVIATIFIPLTFFAGVWGMNFDPGSSSLNMPELRWRWGYPAALGLMFLVAVFMLFFFWRRGWLGRPDRPPDSGIPRDDNSGSGRA